MNPTGGGPGLTLDPPILAANPARGSPPSADRRLPKGATLRVRRRSTLDGARERGSSTMIGGSRLRRLHAEERELHVEQLVAKLGQRLRALARDVVGNELVAGADAGTEAVGR